MLKIIVLIFIILFGTVQAEVLQVGSQSGNCRECKYNSINQALKDANPGDKIEVFSGTYAENITVNMNDISLIGKDSGSGRPTIVRGIKSNIESPCSEADGLKRAIIKIAGGNVILKNFNLTRLKDRVDENCAVTVESDDNVIEGNLINNYEFGIVICNSANNIIRDNYISNNSKMGIHLAGSSNNLLVCNTVKGSNHNIDLDSNSKNNQIYMNYLGRSNSFNAYDPGVLNSNMWNNTTIGNYYDNYICAAEQNGLCSGEYEIKPGSNIDWHPLSKNFFSSQTLHICGSCGLYLQANASRRYAIVGDNISFNLSVLNSGNYDFSSINIACTELDDNEKISGLKIGERKTIIFPKIYTVKNSDLPGPLIINFSAFGRAGDCSSNISDSCIVNLVSIAFDKTPNRTSVCLNESINYKYKINNQGSTMVKNLTINDTKICRITPDKTELQAGEKTSADGMYQVKYTDYPAVVNEATLFFEDPDGRTRNVTDNASVAIDKYCINLTLEKTVNKRVAEVGETVTYRYDVINTGKMPLKNLTLIDGRLGDIQLQDSPLLPGQATSATASYTIREDDWPAVVNTAIARGWSDFGQEANDTDSARVDILKIEFDKTANRSMACPGEGIRYRYDIRNLGNVTVKNLTINDSKIGRITPDKTELKAGENTSADGIYQVKYTDYPAVVNEAILYYDDLEGRTRNTSDEASVAVASGRLTLIKTADREFAQVGDTVKYSYEITNNGCSPLTNLSLNDSKIGSIEINETLLLPGHSIRVEALYTVRKEDLPVLINYANLTGYPLNGTPITDWNLTRIDLFEVVLDKVADRSQACVGDIVNYTFRINYSGSVPITPLSLLDDSIGEIAINNSPINGSQILVANGSAVAQRPGYMNNTATLEYLDPSGKTAKAIDSASVTVVSDCIIFTKEASLDSACPGDVIAYNFTLINRLDKQINSITVIDDKLGTIAINRTALKPGDQSSGTKLYTVKEEDLPGPLVNVAEYTAYDRWNRMVSGWDTEEVRLYSCNPRPCNRKCCDCPSTQINNYVNISGSGQNFQVFSSSNGTASVSNTSQSISQDQNANNTDSRFKSAEYH